MTIEHDALSRGFNAGNYANAYVSTDLEEAWEEECEEHEDEENVDECAVFGHEAYRAGFVLGFFGSYEDDEVCEGFDELLEARASYGAMAISLGIAVNMGDEDEESECG